MKYNFDSKEFSKRIKTKRVIELNIDLRTVAKKSKVSSATISRLENGGIPEMRTFLKMCEWLDALPREFIFTIFKKEKHN